jgi:hypothetical protein
LYLAVHACQQDCFASSAFYWRHFSGVYMRAPTCHSVFQPRITAAGQGLFVALSACSIFLIGLQPVSATSLATNGASETDSSNAAPVAESQAVVTAEDNAKVITLSGSDVENEPLIFSIVTNPEHGLLSGSLPNLTYTPASNYFGPDGFTFKVTAGSVESVPATISIDVTPVNDAPVAADLFITTAGDMSQTITLSGSDVEGSPLSYTVLSLPSGGTLSGAAPDLTYFPSSGVLGEDSFTYKVNDGSLDSLPATVKIVITDYGVYHQISGRVGVGGATLSYNDYFGPGSVVADADGNYTLVVHSGWTGTVTPSMPGYFFTPAQLGYSEPVVGDLADQNYIAGRVMTYHSTGSDDGWVLEASETSQAGGSLNATDKTFSLGDDALRRQYKAILSFNIQGIPASATIIAVELKIKQSGSAAGGGNLFSQLGSLLVDIKKGAFGMIALQASDFQATALKAGRFKVTPVSGWYSALLPAVGRNNINRAGVTQFRLYFTKDDNNNAVANYMKFYSGDNATMQPTLIITYTLP